MLASGWWSALRRNGCVSVDIGIHAAVFPLIFFGKRALRPKAFGYPIKALHLIAGEDSGRHEQPYHHQWRRSGRKNARSSHQWRDFALARYFA
jgi:hypothetical protein